MTAAPFILCVFWCASDPSLGATLVKPEQAVIFAAGGIDTVVPTVSLGARAGLTEHSDLSFRYDVRGGLVHRAGVSGRFRAAERWALGLTVAHGFVATEEVGGADLAQVPLANGLDVTAMPLLHSLFTPTGTHVAFGLGVTVGLVGLQEELLTIERHWDPTFESVHLQVAAEWEGDGTTTYLSFRALVPIQADFQVLGYLPWVSVGRTWSLD